MNSEKESLPMSTVTVPETKPVCPYCKLAVTAVRFRLDGGPEMGPFVVVTFVCPSCQSVLGIQLLSVDDAKKLKPAG
jgi:transposase-like protein